ncbi:hypothetical protein C5167_035442 [Papaver somniferum]|uniref:Pentatricopeptide repeat-containing protein n=1 Tax=Papaver somniferum TaxID=3469 RepID=A0A4Y7KIV2_PAPSO|nr:pentatricopeptide repeat-containing protein At2g20540-like [Papaver somniferum]RZC72280.1 hypothetical protein C5167_035442 [Papaver somniferum]
MESDDKRVRFDPVIVLFKQMERTGMAHAADEFTYSFLLTACSQSAFLLREGEQVHARILLKGLCSNVILQTKLINMYAVAGGDNGNARACEMFGKMTQRSVVTCNLMLSLHFRSGRVGEAQKLFQEIPEKNVVSWTTMISGYVRNGRCELALALFCEMQRAGTELDQVALVAALSACADLGDLKLGRWIHSYIAKGSDGINLQKSVSLTNAIIRMYASCGAIEEAYRTFRGMPHRSLISWNTMIVGFAKQGCGVEALGVFRWMLTAGVRPDEVTFLGVLCACSHTGMVKEGRRYLDYMILSCEIQPNIKHYGCMVDLLSRAGLLDEAQQLIQTIPMEPNDVIWGALLSGCRVYKNMEIAKYAGDHIVELEPDRVAGHLVLLANVYASAKEWDNVEKIKQRMVKKPSRRSWIQVNGVVRDFVVGDLTHENAHAIYNMASQIAHRSV